MRNGELEIRGGFLGEEVMFGQQKIMRLLNMFC